jgi:hypothetical protein
VRRIVFFFLALSLALLFPSLPLPLGQRGGVAWAVGTLEPWNAAHELEPSNNDPVADADDRMLDIKINTRHRGEVEHYWGDIDTAGSNDNGLHRVGSARCFAQATAPTTLSNSMGSLDSIVPTRNDVTDLNDAASNTAAAIADDVGHGRCWIDTDDNSFYVYVGEAGDNTPVSIADGWVPVVNPTGGNYKTDDQVLTGSANLAYNGSFEATGGTGESTSTAAPTGWSATTATVAYATAGDIRWGAGYHANVTATSGGGYISQSLILNANTVYKVIARVKDDGVTTCSLDVDSEGGTGFTLVTTTTNDWETLSGTFGTDPAALDTLSVRLITNSNGQLCSWDHIQVYQVGDVTTDRAEISVPTMVVAYDTTTEAGDIASVTPAAVTGLRVDVNPPQSNCIINVNAIVAWETDTSNDVPSVTCILDESGVSKHQIAQSIDLDENRVCDGVGGCAASIVIPYTKTNPTPGTALVYTVKCAGRLPTLDDSTNIDYNCTNQTCAITAVMFCGGH